MRLFVKCRKKRIRQRKTYMICAAVGFAQKMKRKRKMKKLLVLLMVIAFCFTGCDVIAPIIDGITGDNQTDIPNVPDNTDKTPDTDEEIPKEDEDDSTPSHKHSYSVERTEPTCTEDGVILYFCECGKEFTTPLTATGHSFRKGACTACGEADPNYQGGSTPEECDFHTDINDDGYCDECDEYVIVIIDIYGINDLHGKLTATDTQPGIGGLTTYLKTNKTENAILLSSGDMWQGSSESNLTYGAIMTEWMNSLGFASMTLGNHEYDWGESYIEANADLADFPLLAINVYSTTTNERVAYASSSVVLERNGVQIGIIGAMGDCYSSISGAVSDGFYFKTGNELANLVKAEAERLRANGVDFIIYSLHDDDASYQSVLSDGYVDIVFEAHTHQSYVSSDSYGVYHLQGGGENKGITYALVSINSANGNTKVTKASFIKADTYRSYAADPIIDELLDKYSDMIDDAYEVLGYNKQYRDDEEIEQVVAQLYYEYGVAKWGNKYDIVLGGGFIRTRTPYNLYAGEVTYSDVYSLLPFDNELVLCSVKGSDLKKKFINTNNSDYFIYGNFNASSIQDSKTYYIVTDTYTSTYSYNNLTEIERATDGVYARDLVADFVRKGGWS